MIRQSLFNTAAALWTILGASHLRADPRLPEYIVPPSVSPVVAPVATPDEPYTVLTMAPNGSWGVATSIFIGEAITGAMTDCKRMSGPRLGCGYMSKTITAGWILGVRCGRENILAANKTLPNAELAALNREAELRNVYAKSMPRCVRVVTVDPNGQVVGSGRDYAAPKLEQGGVTID
jgi:hypothetical protein